MKKINPFYKYVLTLMSIFRTNIRDYGMFIALAVIFLTFSILTNGIFLGAINFTNLLNQGAYVAVLAVGMTLVIVARQIDLSVGFIGAFLGAFVVVSVEINNYPVFLALLIALAITIVVGIIKGFFVANIKVPSFVVTLAGMFIFRGLLMFQTNNRTIPTASSFFNSIGVGYLSSFKIGGFDVLTIGVGVTLLILMFLVTWQRRRKNIELKIKNSAISIYITQMVISSMMILLVTYNLASFRGISYLLLITVFVVVVYNYLTTQTVLGRRIYAVGGNPDAAELSGISVQKIIIVVFVSMGILAMIAGVMYASMVQNASPNHGPFWELYAIAAAYIGGTSASGGIGKVVNAVVGALVLTSLRNGMALAGVNANLEPIVLGSVLLLAVVFDIYTRNVSAIDFVGIYYAKQKYRKEYELAVSNYKKLKNDLDIAKKSNSKDIVQVEYRFTKALAELNKIRDNINVAKAEDYSFK
jgi:putative multiple sugar transport system permease protein